MPLIHKDSSSWCCYLLLLLLLFSLLLLLLSWNYSIPEFYSNISKIKNISHCYIFERIRCCGCFDILFWDEKKIFDLKSLLFKITFHVIKQAWQSLSTKQENYARQQAWQYLYSLLSLTVLPIFIITDHSIF